MSKIKSIKSREILNSKGEPTLEVEVGTDDGVFRASVPSGVSKGKYEAVELRDGGERYFGKGVMGAVKNINEIIFPRLKGKKVTSQTEIDEFLIELDGQKDKSRLGANAILAVSMAVCRAGAAAQKLSLWQWLSELSQREPILPEPCLLALEGGVHGGSDLDVQEFMIVPRRNYFGGSSAEMIRAGAEIYHTLGLILNGRYNKSGTGVGIEGGFVPPLKKTEEALDLLLSGIEKSGYRGKVKIILDIAASVFFRDEKYYFENKTLTGGELLDFYSGIFKKYPILAIEDPFGQEDWQGWKKLNSKLKTEGSKILVIGDDLTATNPERIKTAAEKKACQGLILKPNQIGTVSETINSALIAQNYGWQVFVKHRGGETCDDFIADLSVGLGTGWLMAGAPNRGERVAKYNRLMKIEKEMAEI